MTTACTAEMTYEDAQSTNSFSFSVASFPLPYFQRTNAPTHIRGTSHTSAFFSRLTPQPRGLFNRSMLHGPSYRTRRGTRVSADFAISVAPALLREPRASLSRHVLSNF